MSEVILKTRLIESRVKIEQPKRLASRQFSEQSCPLQEDHWISSKLLFGMETYTWDCEFCGKNEQH